LLHVTVFCNAVKYLVSVAFQVWNLQKPVVWVGAA